MKCRKYKLKLALYVGGDLLENEIPALLTHLGECPDCAAELELLKQSRRGLEKILRSDTPDPLPRNFALIIQERIKQEEATKSSLVRRRIMLKGRKPAIAIAALLAAFYLGVGLSWNYWHIKMQSAYFEHILVRSIFENLQTELGEELRYDVFKGSSHSDGVDLPLQPGIFIIMHKSILADKSPNFTIDYFGESDNLRLYHQYPWFPQRRAKLIQRAGLPENIFIIICPLPGMSRSDRRHLKELLISRVESSLTKGI